MENILSPQIFSTKFNCICTCKHEYGIKQICSILIILRKAKCDSDIGGEMYIQLSILLPDLMCCHGHQDMLSLFQLHSLTTYPL